MKTLFYYVEHRSGIKKGKGMVVKKTISTFIELMHRFCWLYTNKNWN